MEDGEKIFYFGFRIAECGMGKRHCGLRPPDGVTDANSEIV